MQPGDAEQVDKADLQALPVIVMRGAMRAGMVAHRHRDHLPAGADEQRRQEAVDMVEMRQLQEGLRGGTVSGRSRYPGVASFSSSGAHAVGDARAAALGAGILAV